MQKNKLGVRLHCTCTKWITLITKLSYISTDHHCFTCRGNQKSSLNAIVFVSVYDSVNFINVVAIFCTKV